MTTKYEITTAASKVGLSCLGGFVPEAGDGVSPSADYLLLLGPDGHRFWSVFAESDEFNDGKAHPIDRWSTRVIRKLAQDFGAEAIFPFGGPPYHPFYRWALRTGRCWPSPVSLLVHETAGLMVSFRGALALPFGLDLPVGRRPCDTCNGQPCLTSCPVDAFGGEGYDTKSCHEFLDLPEGQPCMTGGCRARRSCPVGLADQQPIEQSQLHMNSFHPK
ncbi:MAG: ferredoxin [Brevirhabdus sp.]